MRFAASNPVGNSCYYNKAGIIPAQIRARRNDPCVPNGVPELPFEPDVRGTNHAWRVLDFDTLSDTLRSGRGCDFWTRLDPEFANSLNKTADLDTSGRGWTAHNVIRSQQVSGSSPLAGSNGINNLQRFAG